MNDRETTAADVRQNCAEVAAMWPVVTTLGPVRAVLVDFDWTPQAIAQALSHAQAEAMERKGDDRIPWVGVTAFLMGMRDNADEPRYRG